MELTIANDFQSNLNQATIKRNFNSCSSKTLKNNKNPTVSTTFTLLRKNLADNFP